jgi:hypothetical protein
MAIEDVSKKANMLCEQINRSYYCKAEFYIFTENYEIDFKIKFNLFYVGINHQLSAFYEQPLELLVRSAKRTIENEILKFYRKEG